MSRFSTPSAAMTRSRRAAPLLGRFGRRARGFVAAATTVLIATAGVVTAVTPAYAALGDPGQVTLDKSVDGVNSITAEPGDTFTYGFLVGCDDEACIDAELTDQVPEAFDGFTIESLQVSPASAPVTVGLTGCSVGGPVTASCLLQADFNASLGDLLGEPQFGIPAGTTYRINLQLTVPPTLPATWPFNGDPIVNTATADADTSLTPRSDSATVTVTIPIVVDVTPTKSWTPSDQLYAPGAASTFTIGAQNTSNLPASALVLQDPQVAPEGALALDPSNPFTFVDFTGLCAPSALPTGADQVQVDLYVRSAPSEPWNWVIGVPNATAILPAYAGEVGGVRLSYTSTTGATIDAGGAASAQCVSVAQRSANRTTGDALVQGATANNTVNATVTVPGYAPVSETSSASLTIGPLNVIVEAGKTMTPSIIPAGASFAVNLSAQNDSNGPLTSLTITEPSGDAFLSDDLTFDAFTGWTWPTGATVGTFTWQFALADDVLVPLTPLGGAPAVPAPGPGDWITGFTVTYTGEIPAGVTAGMTFSVATDPGMVEVIGDDVSDAFVNEIEVSGTNPAGTADDRAEDDVTVFFPEIELEIVKSVSPALVTPGGTVVVELETTTAASSARVNPTQIVVEDVWRDTPETDFWDAFRARELSFIAIPSGSTLTVRYTTESPATDPIVWNDLVVDTAGIGGLYSNDLSVLVGADTANQITGFQFVFTNSAGFAQGTIVKPNIVFEASPTLRLGPGATTTLPTVPVQYENVATADGEGVSGGQTVQGDEVDDSALTAIVSFGGDTGPGPATVLSAKDWVQSNWTTNQSAPLPA